MPQIVFPEFRDATENTKYPFIDTATLTDTENKLTIPNDLITDSNLYIPGVTSMVYLSYIHVYDNKTVIGIQDSDNTVQCTGTIYTLDSVSRDDYILPIYKDAYKVGALVIAGNKVSYFKSIEKGTYTFEDTATAFLPSCITMLPNMGITSISVNERTEGNTVYGDIWLVGWKGVTLRTQQGVDNSIRVDVMGDPLFTQAKYPNTPYDVQMPIMTINGVEPNIYGNFNITTQAASDSLRINTTEHGLYIYMAGANGN